MLATITTQCQQLLDREQALFEKEYQKYYVEGETKPKTIGAPYLLHQPQSRQGILLIHGLMAAPEEVREWADFLFSEGYSVYAPRMAGHGTSSEDLSQRDMMEWVASVERGRAILSCCCEQIVVAGFSTGGAVALYQAIKNPNAFDALISISAPLKFKKFSAHFAAPINKWNHILKLVNSPFFNTKRLRKEFVTNHADNPHINYLRCPVNGIVQIQRLMKEVYRGLPSISIPVLIIHANEDPKVDVQSARDIFLRILSPKKQYQEIDYHLHGIIRGPVSQSVFKEVRQFLQVSLTCSS